MNVTTLKKVMNQINEPNEFELFFHADEPFYWVYRVDGVRVKDLYKTLVDLRKPTARFDVFINGLFISENDYIFDQLGNDFYIKFIKVNFPEFDRFNNPYILDEEDEVKVEGDVEKFK
jgi:hypothetical protein